MSDHTELAHRNEVLLVGRLAAAPEQRALPSGDEITCWRLVVGRDGGGQDTFDCTAWTARPRRASAAWQPGDTVEVEGALRRRFWRGAGGAPASRYDIEVLRARRLARGQLTRPRTRG